MMNKAFLLTGGNMGEREAYLEMARDWISRDCGDIVKASALYETAAWGKTDQADFLNQAIQIRTPLNARQLIRHLLKVEKKMGRVREEKYGARIIDIDILLFNNEILETAFLVIPHPEMQNRRFVLTPLAEIAPDLQHPVFLKTISEMLMECPDQLPVRKLGVDV